MKARAQEAKRREATMRAKLAENLKNMFNQKLAETRQRAEEESGQPRQPPAQFHALADYFPAAT